MSNDVKERSDYLYRKGPYLYFRYPKALGLKPVSLPPDETSPEFARCYDACLAIVTASPKPKALPTISEPVEGTRRLICGGGTIGAAILKYQASTEFSHDIKASTRRKYRETLSVMSQRIGELPFGEFDTDAVDDYSDGLTLAFGASVANAHVWMLSLLYKCVRKFPEFGLKGKINPTTEAVRRYTVKTPTPAWNETAQQKFTETAPAHLIEGYVMLRYGAQRAGDTIRIAWEDFDGEGLTVTPEKQGTEGGIPNYHLCVDPLLRMLETLAEKRLAAGRPLTGPILLNAKGKPWTSSSDMSEAIRNHLIKIGLAERGTRTINMHGLRGNAASDVAELLLGTNAIKSVTGHISNQMAEYYARNAERRAINKKVNLAWNELLKEKSAKRAASRRDHFRAVK
jgi:integrase